MLDKRSCGASPKDTASRRSHDAAVRLALEFGEKVRDEREALGLSQRDLAARMGTSQAAVARLEAGGVGSTLTTPQRVADALGMAISVDLEPAG